MNGVDEELERKKLFKMLWRIAEFVLVLVVGVWLVLMAVVYITK